MSVNTIESTKTYEEEVKDGERFEFGKNWACFLNSLTDDKIDIAKKSIKDVLKIDDISGKRVLDIGSGSGLFSLSSRLLGATVHSFDFDPNSVGCTKTLKERYAKDDDNWTIEQASVLDKDYVKSLGEFDIVYSWGVLHHTGDMETALTHADIPVKKGGTLCIAIYNDQGIVSKFWTLVKRIYCKSLAGKALMSMIFIPYFAIRAMGRSMRLFNGNPFKEFIEYKQNRGMHIYYDWLDWLGGYPFEVASVEKITSFYNNLGYERVNLIECTGLGCSQFTFIKK